MTRRRRLDVGLGLCAVLAAVDIIGLAAFGMPDDAPPAVVIVVAAILGVLTLAGCRSLSVAERDPRRRHRAGNTGRLPC